MMSPAPPLAQLAAAIAAGALGYALNVLFLVAERKIVHWSGR